jgi:hypothetical protein
MVKPLPEVNKPANFNGAVGNFTIEASLANKTVAAQDEATLHVVVKGKGNLPVLTAPVVDWPAGVDAFDPTAKEDVNKTVVPMSGSKSFDYIFTARDSGHYLIPAVNLSYFDPSSQTYKIRQQRTAGVTGNAGGKKVPGLVRRRRNGGACMDGWEGFLTSVRWKWHWPFYSVWGLVALFWKLRKKKVQSQRTRRPFPEVSTPLPKAAYVPAAPAPDPLADARRYL